MKVFAVHFGDRYRGAELIGMYAKEERALIVAVALLDEQEDKWLRRNPEKDEKGIVRAWQSKWNEIIVYVHDVK